MFSRGKLLFILVFGYIIFFFASVNEYAPHGDAICGDLFYGERQLYFYLTLDPSYFDFTRRKLRFYEDGSHPDLFPPSLAMYNINPFPHTISALSCLLFSRKLKLLDPFDAHHAGTLFFTIPFVAILFLFLCKYVGKKTAFFSVLFLFLQPRFLGHSMNNNKDIAEACMFGITAVLYAESLLTRNRKLFLLSSFIWGTALATKANSLFVPVILALWIIPVWARERRLKDVAYFLPVIMPSVALAVIAFFLCWPYFWFDTFHRLYMHWANLRYVVRGDIGVTLGAVKELLYVTPIPLTVLLALGPLSGKNRSRIFYLFALWLLVTAGRTMLPGAWNYDGIRHFLEALPAIGVLAGFGMSTALGWNIPRSIKGILLCVVSGILLFNIYDTHPFETTFYNPIPGRLEGAINGASNEDPGDYWGNSFRKGIEWLNENAGEDGLVVFAGASHVAPYARWWLRKGLEFATFGGLIAMAPEERRNGRGVIYVFVNTSPRFQVPLAGFSEERGKLLHAFLSQGYPVLKIFELRKETIFPKLRIFKESMERRIRFLLGELEKRPDDVGISFQILEAYRFLEREMPSWLMEKLPKPKGIFLPGKK